MPNPISALSKAAGIASAIGTATAVMGDEEAEKIAEKTRVKICSFLEADAKNITNNVVEFIKDEISKNPDFIQQVTTQTGRAVVEKIKNDPEFTKKLLESNNESPVTAVVPTTSVPLSLPMVPVPTNTPNIGSSLGNLTALPLNATSNIVGAAGDLTNAATNVAGNTVGAVGDIAGKGLGAVSDLTGNTLGAVTNVAGKGLGAVSDLTGNTLGAVTNVAGNTVGAVGDIAGKGLGAVGDLAGNTVGAVGDIAGKGLGAVGQGLGAVGQGVGGLISAPFSLFSAAPTPQKPPQTGGAEYSFRPEIDFLQKRPHRITKRRKSRTYASKTRSVSKKSKTRSAKKSKSARKTKSRK
uniref:Uncharacterized protein n=1 Tax=viral metagenome TaxID=1070528 RepID=A0A6C0AT75_9ZZZZ